MDGVSLTQIKHESSFTLEKIIDAAVEELARRKGDKPSDVLTEYVERFEEAGN